MDRLREITEQLKSYQPDARPGLLEEAHRYSTEARARADAPGVGSNGLHALDVAQILTEIHMDDATVACGLLHDAVVDGYVSPEEVRAQFGEDLFAISEGLAKVTQVRYSSRAREQAENFRRLILAIAKDVRAVIIKLADHLAHMRELGDGDADAAPQMARESLDLYAPLANRLGIHRIKTELEDLGFRHAHPDIWEDLTRKIEERTEERDEYVAEVTGTLSSLLRETGAHGQVSGRLKHLYSVYKKMVDQGISFDKVYDLIAFRIIVPELRDCYAMLGVIHARWTPVPGRFKDYIALPKPNLYQSLHTTVIGPKGQPMEVQIRTEEMHRIAEEGIAAHWRYKEKREGPRPEDRVFQWLRRLIETNQEIGDASEFLESVQVELFPDLVFVFTPAGDLLELPRGSTPVDFAYAVHTQVGERCVGAKTNGRMVPLNHRLKNGDRVEIITSKSHTPSADWLEFVATTKARNKIRHWVKTRQRERSVELGRDVCDRTFRKAGYSFNKIFKEGALEPIAQKFGLNKGEELLEAVGYGRVSARQVLGKLYPETTEKETEEAKRPKRTPKAPKGIVIRGVGDAMVRFARCCSPVPGERVVGFVTRGQGMTVHTADCLNMGRLDPERKVPVEWGGREDSAHPVKIRVYCVDRKGILAAITQVLAQQDVQVVHANVRTFVVGEAECSFEILVENLDRLQKIVAAIQALKGVNRVVRLKT